MYECLKSWSKTYNLKFCKIEYMNFLIHSIFVSSLILDYNFLNENFEC